MNQIRALLFAGVLVSLSSAAAAQEVNPADYEMVLLPILAERTPGLFGSDWFTIFRMYNDAEIPAAFYPIRCDILCPGGDSFYVRSKRVEGPSTDYASVGEPPGRLFYVHRNVAQRVTFNLRIQDRSRQAQTWGTEIPVIREPEFLVGKAQLFDVPITAGFRPTLRIYDVDGTGRTEIIVRFYSVSATLLSEMRLPLLVTRRQLNPPTEPGYAQLASFAELFPGEQRLRIELEPASAGLRYWAFVSVTNNETQHVTTITPQ